MLHKPLRDESIPIPISLEFTLKVHVYDIGVLSISILPYTVSSSFDIFFGIDSSNKSIINERFTTKRDIDHRFYATGFNGQSIWTYTNETSKDIHAYGIKTGDIIKMELNCKDKIIKWYKNEKFDNVISKDIDFDNKKYNMAVEFICNSGKELSVKLINFNHIHA